MRKGNITYNGLFRLLVSFVFAGTLVLLAVSSGLAQITQGDFTGVVKDTSGAVVPGAKITIVNDTTHSTRIGVTNSTGSYRMNGFAVGTYTIQAEKAGFRTAVVTGVGMSPSIVVNQDFTLTVGGQVQKVQVTGAVSMVQQQSPEITTTLPTLIYKKYPLEIDISNFAMDALAFAPGSAAGEAVYSYNGNRSADTGSTVEGMQINPFSNWTNFAAVKSVNVIAQNAPAEYARAANQETTINSGSNAFHGDGTLQMNSNRGSGCPNARNNPFSIPGHSPCVFRRFWYFGGGGPVYLPKIYDGRNKTFFYVTYSWEHNLYPNIFPTVNVPSVPMQHGDFSQYPVTIIDPTTGQPFSGNIIPPSRISPVATYINNTYYNLFNYVGSPNSFTGNAFREGAEKDAVHSYNVRIDQNFGTRDTLSFTYTYSNNSFVNSGAGGPDVMPISRYIGHAGWVAALGETHSFGAHAVNEARIGVSRDWSNGGPAVVGFSHTPILGAATIAAMGLQGIPLTNLPGLPCLGIGSWPGIPGYACAPSPLYETFPQGYDNFSINKGRHNLKFGISATDYEQSSFVNPGFGSFNFSGTFTNEPYADFLLGLPQSIGYGLPRPAVAARNWEVGVFAEDHFQVSPKLTLSYGLRWDKDTVPVDANGMYYTYDMATGQVVVPNQFAVNHVNGVWNTTSFPVVTAAQAGYPEKLINGSSTWEPRFGFAWRPLGPKTVIRGGYGIYTPFYYFPGLQTGGPFTASQSVQNLADPASPTGAQYSFPNPIPSTLVVSTNTNITAVNPNLKIPYTQNWNLTVARQLPGNWGLEVSYLGTKATNLLWGYNANSPVASSIPFSPSTRPNPALGNIQYDTNGGNAWYEGMEIHATHPFSHGLWFDAAYTINSSGADLQDGLYGQAFGAGFGSTEYAYNRSRDYGRQPGFPLDNFIANFAYQLPFGAGRAFGSNWGNLGSGGKVLNAILGGWTFSGYGSWRSGWFFTPTFSGPDPAGLGNFNGRANVVSGCDPYAGLRQLGKGRMWFNPQCFSVPSTGQLGNAQVNSLTGPSAFVLTVNPYKDFPLNFIREGTVLQFGAEIWNLTNTPSYANPNSTITDANAGEISGTNNPRQMGIGENGARYMNFFCKIMF